MASSFWSRYVYIFILLLIIIFFRKQLLFLIYFLSNLIKSSIQRWFPINLGTLNKMKSVVVLLFCILYCEVSGCTIVVYFISLWLIIKSNTFGCFCWWFVWWLIYLTFFSSVLTIKIKRGHAQIRPKIDVSFIFLFF